MLVVCAVGTGAAQAAVGVQDFSYADPAGPTGHQPTAPTGEKPQSKVWFNDGIWWGSIWSKTKYTIQRYDVSGTWVNTGVAIDPRDKSQADMLWDGTHLYAISNVHEASSTNDPAVRLYRFSYDATTKSYSPDAGFPIVIFEPSSTTDLETVAIDKDSTGMLWATFTYANVPGSCTSPSACPAGRSVYTAHSTTSDSVWSTPAVLPVPNAGNVSGNDISSIVHFGNKIGVMFSDQVKDPVTGFTADYFAVHADGQPDTSWTEETPLSGKLAADDHINLKAAPDGRLYAAVKTSRNDAGTPVATDPLILLLERSTAGAWSQYTFDTVASQDTRSQILLDPTDGVIYQFATYPPSGLYEHGGWIYCKVTSMNAPSFPAGRGTPFIQLGDTDQLNNFSTTKQTVSPASGLLGIASDDNAHIYAHNSLALTGTPSCAGAPITPPVVVTPPVTPPVTPVPPVKPVAPVTPVTPVTPVSKPTVPVVTVTTTSTTSATCRVVSSGVKIRSLSSRISVLKSSSVVRLRVKTTCAVHLTLAAAIGTRHGAVVGRASVYLKKGTTRTVLVHLTRSGRKLIAKRQNAHIYVTTRTPAVKGLSPARLWSTTIAFRS